MEHLRTRRRRREEDRWWGWDGEMERDGKEGGFGGADWERLAELWALSERQGDRERARKRERTANIIELKRMERVISRQVGVSVRRGWSRPRY